MRWKVEGQAFVQTFLSDLAVKENKVVVVEEGTRVKRRYFKSGSY